MNSQILPSYNKQAIPVRSAEQSPFQSILALVENIFSLALLSLSAIFFAWMNQKHNEFQSLENISNQ